MSKEYAFGECEPGESIVETEIPYQRNDGELLLLRLTEVKDASGRTILSEQKYPVNDILAFNTQNEKIWSVWDDIGSDLPRFDWINRLYIEDDTLKIVARNNFMYDLDPYSGKASSKGWFK